MKALDPLPWIRGRHLPLLLALLAVPTSLYGFAVYEHDQAFSTAWSGPVAFIGLATLAWHQQRFRLPRAFAVGAGIVALFVALGMPFGFTAGELVRMGVVNAAVLLAGLAFYRHLLGRDGWFPTTPRDVLALSVAMSLVACGVVWLGGVPGWWADGFAARYQLWWILRINTNLLFGATVLFTVCYPPRPSYGQLMYPRYLPLIGTLCVACMVLPFIADTFPLDWLVFVPAVWIGLTLPLRFIGIAAGSMALVPTLFGRSELARVTEHDGWLPPSLVMDVVLAGSLCLCLIIAAYREHMARVSAEASEAAEHDAAQAALLNSVIRTMTDGVLLTSPDGRIVLSNPATRAMLGTPPPGRPRAGDWATSYDLRAQDGSPLDDELRQRLLRPPADDFARVTVAVPTGGTGAYRYYSIAARALRHGRDGHDRHNLVLISDTTTEHTRHRELESFAGTVAHDLKNPWPDSPCGWTWRAPNCSSTRRRGRTRWSRPAKRAAGCSASSTSTWRTR